MHRGASSGQKRLIQRDVALRASLPTEISRHPSLLQLPPDAFVAVSRNRALCRSEQSRSGRWREYEPGCNFLAQRLRVVVDHRIVQPAGIVIDGRRAIALTVHL